MKSAVRLIKFGKTSMLVCFFMLAVTSVSSANSNSVTLKELDHLVGYLKQGKVISSPVIMDVFHIADKGKLVDSYNYGIGRARISRTFAYRSFMVDGDVDKITLETLGDSNGVLRIHVFFNAGKCVNALSVINRYGLIYTPLPDPSPDALSVAYTRKYKGGNLSANIPVPRGTHPSSGINSSSCISDVRVLVNAN